jgi:predicted SPOUT superfamily RNA methylase MTH1
MKPSFSIIYVTESLREFEDLMEKFKGSDVGFATKEKSEIELEYNRKHGRFHLTQREKLVMEMTGKTREEIIQARMLNNGSEQIEEETEVPENVTGL